jgi:hypothetical protein
VESSLVFKSSDHHTPLLHPLRSANTIIDKHAATWLALGALPSNPQLPRRAREGGEREVAQRMLL